MFILIITVVGLGGGTFIATKLLLSFLTGRTQIHGAKSDDSNILSQIDKLRVIQRNQQNVSQHNDFIDFAISKDKKLSQCRRCNEQIIINKDDQSGNSDCCQDCQPK